MELSPVMSELRPHSLTTLQEHGINCSLECFSCKQQATSLLANAAVHADIKIVTDGTTGIQFVEKTFGRKREVPGSYVSELAADYETMFTDYERIGIDHLASNYNLQTTFQGENAELTVEQLYFPEGTALDWMIKGDRIPEVINSIATNCLIPVLSATDDRIYDDQSWVFLDASLKNFAVLDDDEEIKTFYLDFWVPRVRNESGEIKTYPDFHPHKISEDEIRQRFFSKRGILQNFIRKSVSDLNDHQDSLTDFKRAISTELKVQLDTFFPGMTLDDIVTN